MVPAVKLKMHFLYIIQDAFSRQQTVGDFTKTRTTTS